MLNKENPEAAQLTEHLNTMFMLCGLPGEELGQPVNTKSNLLGGFLRNSGQDHWMEDLDRKVLQAIENLKVQKMDRWNAVRSEQYIEELEQQLVGQRDQIAQLQQLLEQLPDPGELDQDRTLDCAFDQEDAPSQEQPADGADSRETELWWIRQMIGLRDRLLQKLDWVENLPPQEQASARKLIELQLQETASMLEGRQVTVLDGGGSFCREYQTVMMTRPAPSEDCLDQIAQVVRPGYAWNGEVLRAQEVVLYVKEDSVCP